MSNVAIIFAGGTGTRMNSKSKPKQFLELHGKPILIYTLEKYSNHPQIDSIILVVLEDWIQYCYKLIDNYSIKKIDTVIAGGTSAFESQRIGIDWAIKHYSSKSVVLIHDGVRPLINEDTISRAIYSVEQFGSAITVSPAIETIAVKGQDGSIQRIIERSCVELARAPQCFYLENIHSAHEKAKQDRMTFIDSASLMLHYGYKLYTVEGTPENIKITTPSDFYTFRALIDANEDSQIFGL